MLHFTVMDACSSSAISLKTLLTVSDPIHCLNFPTDSGCIHLSSSRHEWQNTAGACSHLRHLCNSDHYHVDNKQHISTFWLSCTAFTSGYGMFFFPIHISSWMNNYGILYTYLLPFSVLTPFSFSIDPCPDTHTFSSLWLRSFCFS